MSDPKSVSVDFEATLTELEDIVERLAREGLGLDEAIALFEQGITRLRAANHWLDGASGRVEELISTAAGELRARPFEGGGEEGEDSAGPDDEPGADSDGASADG